MKILKAKCIQNLYGAEKNGHYALFKGNRIQLTRNRNKYDVIVNNIGTIFLDGMSMYSIASELIRRKIPTPGGKEKWSQSTINRILTNEKYKGDALLQKCFTVDFLQKKVKKNEGEVPQYYVEGNHEAIIEPKMFDIVQDEIAKRSQSKEHYSGVSIFSTKVKCAECGSWYGSKVWHSNDKYRRVIYQCNHKFDGDRKCTTPHLTEDEIKAYFISALNQLVSEKDDVIANIREIQQALCDNFALAAERDALQEEITVVVEMTQKAVAENARVAQDQEEYNKRYNGLVERYESLKNRHEEVCSEISSREARYEQMGKFIEVLTEQESIVTEFDDSLWGSLVDHIVVQTKKNVTVVFRDGTEIKV